jgi:medium-chain acyl-[acyl-carrier-protein] hydrolase
MDKILVLPTHVAYGNVDREERLLLQGVFQLLQEAAIKHANQFDLGTNALNTRRESWVLNRMSVQVHTYPRFEDTLRIETWSSGIQGVRGYRDFRIHRGEELCVSGSSLWIYLNVETRTLARVPPEIAETFPTIPNDVFEPELDRINPPSPNPVVAQDVQITLRYSDFDGNGHVNNTAYFDLLQTALSRANLPTRPGRIQVKFLKEITPQTDTVTVRLEPRGKTVLFSLLSDETTFAQGIVGEKL